MENPTVLVVALVLCLIVIPSSLGLALWLVMRLRRTSDRPLSPGIDGVAVPVRGLSRTHAFFGYSKNSVGPRFSIAPDGLRFKVIRADHWPFEAIEQVDAPRVLFGTRIAFKAKDGGSLFVDVANADRGRDLLRALPPDLSFTARAIGMRDGTP